MPEFALIAAVVVAPLVAGLMVKLGHRRLATLVWLSAAGGNVVLAAIQMPAWTASAFWLLLAAASVYAAVLFDDRLFDRFMGSRAKNGAA